MARDASASIFGGDEPRNLPSYTVAQAARYLRMPAATLRSWIAGRPYPTAHGDRIFEPPIRRSDPGDLRLSFINLVEAHVLRALRTRHGVPMAHIRHAVAYAEEHYDIRRLLIHRDLTAAPGALFLDRYGDLINLSRSGQLAMKEILDAHLERLHHGDDGFPIRFFPWIQDGWSGASVAIDPQVAFGNPILPRRAITTAVLAERFDAGEAIDALASDYQIEEQEIRAAILYERRAA